MKRRDFMRIGAVGAVAAITVSQVEKAIAANLPTPPGDIYYTKDNQGRWAGKAATHLPVIETGKDGGKVTVKVTTPHEIKGYEHYIVKHVLLDKDYKFLAEHFFDPAKDSVPVSTFTLEAYSGALYALSLCNKHDAWVSGADVA